MLNRRIVLEYQGGAVELPLGVTVVGRDIACRLRVHDAGVSRKHFRFVHRLEELYLEDLGSTNGTMVNGRMVKRARLQEGDVIRLGDRSIRVTSGDDFDDGEPQTLTGTRRLEDIAESANRAIGDLPAGDVKKTARIPTIVAHAAVPRACAHCGTPVDLTDDDCPRCGYAWGQFTASTTKVEDDITGRVHERRDISLPLMYRSEHLEIEAETRDLSLGGVFVRTSILDAEGTTADLTILVDGGPPIELTGQVVRVVREQGDDQGKGSGMGVQFLEMTPAARNWLAYLVERQVASEAG